MRVETEVTTSSEAPAPLDHPTKEFVTGSTIRPRFNLGESIEATTTTAACCLITTTIAKTEPVKEIGGS